MVFLFDSYSAILYWYPQVIWLVVFINFLTSIINLTHIFDHNFDDTALRSIFDRILQ